jgi:hypothetical protein
MLSLLTSFCLALASPSKIAAAIGLICTCCGKGYHMFWLSVENHALEKLRKQLSEWITWVELALNGLCWVVPWDHVVEPLNHQVYLTCGWPLRSKEIGDVQVMKLLVQPQVIWALSWPTKLQELKPDGQRVVDVDRLERVRVGLRDCFWKVSS